MLFFVFNPIKIQNSPQKYTKFFTYARKFVKFLVKSQKSKVENKKKRPEERFFAFFHFLIFSFRRIPEIPNLMGYKKSSMHDSCAPLNHIFSYLSS